MPPRRMHRLLVVLLVAACAAAPRPAVTHPDQLPAHRYKVPAAVGQLVVDAAAFAGLARPLRATIERDLAGFDIRDRASLKQRLFILALLDALDGRWPEALARIDRIAAAEVRPADKVMTGLTIRVWTDAVAHGGGAVAFRAALDRRLRAMPLDLVREELSVLRTMGQVFTSEVCRGLVDDNIGAHLQNGEVSLEEAEAIAFQRYAVVHLVPVGAVIDEVLGAHGIDGTAPKR